MSIGVSKTAHTTPRNDLEVAKELLTTAYNGKIYDFRQATQDEDRQLATDCVLNGSINVAIRRRRYTPGSENFRGLTVTTRRANSMAMPEVWKIKAGRVERYLRLWDNKDGGVTDWAYVDLKKMVALGMFDGRDERLAERDQSYFIEIPITEIIAQDCLLAGRIWNLEQPTRGL